MEQLVDKVTSKARKYADDVGEFIEHSSSLLTEAILTFNYELITDIKEKTQEAISQVDGYLFRLEAGYNKSANFLKAIAPDEDSVDLQVMLWDIKRPILYKRQELEELIKSVKNFES